MKPSDGEAERAVTTRSDLPEDVLAALEYVRDHLRHASNYSEMARGMAHRYLLWVLKPKPDGATLTECGNGHKIWWSWNPGDKCPVCVGWVET